MVEDCVPVPSYELPSPMRPFFESPLFSRITKGKVKPDGNSKPAPTVSPLPPQFKPGVCRCRRSEDGRNLVICIDGTSNQFGEMNTNVIELYSMLEKGRKKKQLTWYHSGIGTYARPSFKSPAFYLQVLSHLIDLAIAWNFERTIMAAYEWLSENYEEGDSIYLFGFSRGAFQVRVLAAMIDKVGLIHKGNAMQIPFAYELYCDPESDYPSRSKTSTGSSTPSPKRSLAKRFKHFLRRNKKEAIDLSSDKVSMAEHFKNTFSQPDARVHFVGAWDTVSSIGVVRGKKMLPRTVDGMQHVCYFRHALALDERRVKFLPEYAYGGSSMSGATLLDQRSSSTSGPVPEKSENFMPHGLDERPQTLEVWFAGTHSDIGGGNTANPDMNRSRPPLRWMVYEARGLGLRTRLFERELLPAEKIEFKESLTGVWKLFELIPWRRLTFTTRKGGKEVTYKPHIGAGRKIQHGQKVHISVVDGLGKYHPKARPPEDVKELWSMLPFDIDTQSSWQEGDADTFVKPLVANFVNNKSDSAWNTVCGMANSGDGLQAAYEEVMRFLMAESDQYKAEDDDKLRLVQSAQQLFSDKVLRLRDARELSETMFEIGASSDLKYQTVVWEFLSRYLQYSNNTVFPIQFIYYHIDQLCQEKNEISCGILQRITSVGGDGLQAAYEEVMKLLMAENSDHKSKDDDKLRLVQSAIQLFSGKALRLRDVQELAKTMVEISASSNPKYQTAAWEFLSQFLQYSSNTIVPNQFINYHIDRICKERSDISYDILRTVRFIDECPWQDLYESAIMCLLDKRADNQFFEKSIEHLKQSRVKLRPFGDVKTISTIIQKNCDNLNTQYRTAAWSFLDRFTDCQRLKLEGHSDYVLSVSYSNDGTKLVSGSVDNTVRLWDADTGTQSGLPLSGHTHWVWCVAFSPGGERIVSGSSDSTVRIWDVATGRQIVKNLEGHTDKVTFVAFSPDGRQIVSGSHDCTLRLWDAQTGDQLGEPLEGLTGSVFSVAFSPDGRTICFASGDKTIRLWTTETRQQIGQPLEGHQSVITSIAFSPDGTQIVSGSVDNTVRLWDFETRKQVRQPLQGHTRTVQSVAFSPDGKRIVSGSSDKTMRIWDASTGKQIGESLKGHVDGVNSVVFSPDGTQVASGSYDCTVRVWDVSLKLWDITNMD